RAALLGGVPAVRGGSGAEPGPAARAAGQARGGAGVRGWELPVAALPRGRVRGGWVRPGTRPVALGGGAGGERADRADAVRPGGDAPAAAGGPGGVPAHARARPAAAGVPARGAPNDWRVERGGGGGGLLRGAGLRVHARRGRDLGHPVRTLQLFHARVAADPLRAGGFHADGERERLWWAVPDDRGETGFGCGRGVAR